MQNAVSKSCGKLFERVHAVYMKDTNVSVSVLPHFTAFHNEDNSGLNLEFIWGFLKVIITSQNTSKMVNITEKIKE